MERVLLVVDLLVAMALITVILLQRSEGGALGIGGGGGGMMSARGAANFLTRATTILAALFIGLTLTLAILSRGAGTGESVFDDPNAVLETESPAAEPVTQDDETPEIPDDPELPDEG